MPRSIRQRLGNGIRERREELGLTQEAAAERAGLSPRYWRAIEGAEPAVALEVVEKVLVGLDWSWNDLIGILGPANADGDVPRGARRLFDEAWRRATRRERSVVTATLRVLASGKRTRS
jgi:transcriptional regulator with XRE-family HTH domain